MIIDSFGGTIPATNHYDVTTGGIWYTPVRITITTSGTDITNTYRFTTSEDVSMPKIDFRPNRPANKPFYRQLNPRKKDW